MLHASRHLSRLLCALTLAALACKAPAPPPGGRTVLMSDAEPSVEEAAQAKAPVLITRGDDARAGAAASKQVEAEIGVLEDAALAGFVQELGARLARAVPRSSGYQFKVVDQTVPNAFALPGGFIFVSRGLLALANSEDELANVIGHEIIHAARRHSARQQALAGAQGFSMPWRRAANMAAYGRDMEREADKGGQQIAAALGYDPAALSHFLGSLGLSERLMRGHSRQPSFFDTHPGTRERVAVNAVRAREIRWQRDPARGDTRTSYLRRLDGLALGQRPEVGIFQGRHFIHPSLDFQLLFPPGWETSNSAGAVGAREPKGDAVIFMEPSPPTESLEQAAEELLESVPGAKVRESKAIAVAGFAGWRLEFASGGTEAVVTLIDTGDVTYRITGLSRAIAAKRFRGRLLATPRSFRRLSPEQTRDIRITRLRLVEARSGERLEQLSQRSGNTWSAGNTAVLNGRKPNEPFEGGEWVKVARDERWEPGQGATPPPPGSG